MSTTTKTRTKKAGKRTIKSGRTSKTGTAKKAVKVGAVEKTKSAGSTKQDSRMAIGRGWRLTRDGGKTVFTATLVTTHDLGDRSVALFKFAHNPREAAARLVLKTAL